MDVRYFRVVITAIELLCKVTALMRSHKTSPPREQVSVFRPRKNGRMFTDMLLFLAYSCASRELPASLPQKSESILWTTGGANEEQTSWQPVPSVCPHAGCTFCPDLSAFGRRPTFPSSVPSPSCNCLLISNCKEIIDCRLTA